jgi:DUF4097 and DUF4098 domain-containing protein YvlB
LAAIETTVVSVRTSGDAADDITVEQRGAEIVIRGRPTIGSAFGGRSDLRIDVTLPVGSTLAGRLGSADLIATGHLGAARIRSASGSVRVADVDADTVIETGSGDVAVGSAGAELRARAGSGDIEIGWVTGALAVIAGSGDVRIGVAKATASVKSGTGDIELAEAHGDVTAGSGSGSVTVHQLRRGTLRATTASGDIVVGVPAGVPVWTDVRSVTGDVESDLEGAGRPAAGQDHLEIHATSVTGDVRLSQLAAPTPA